MPVRKGCHRPDVARAHSARAQPCFVRPSLSDPDDKVLLEGEGEKQGDYIFTANTVGEYSFCFENEASLTDRMIDFE